MQHYLEATAASIPSKVMWLVTGVRVVKAVDYLNVERFTKQEKPNGFYQTITYANSPMHVVL